MSAKKRQFKPLNIALLTVSDSRTEESDGSGRLLRERLRENGHILHDQRIVADDIYAVRAVVSEWIATPEVDVVISSGGTGVTGRDATPEAIGVLFDKALDGFGELFRQLSVAQVGSSAMQSRAVAGVANGTYLFVLPGSVNACKTAWDELLAAQLDYRTAPCNLVELMPRLGE